MLGKIYWDGIEHMCADVIIKLNEDDQLHLYNRGTYRLFSTAASIGIPYITLINKRRKATDQMLTPYAIQMYEQAYAKLYGRVLHLGLGLNYGEEMIKCESMIFIENSKDVIKNVTSRYPVIKADATNGSIINKLGRFDTIFVDITTQRFNIDYRMYLKQGGQIISLIP